MNTILFLASNPSATSALKLDEEARGIEESIRAAEFRQEFDLKTAWATRPGDVVKKLLEYQPAIVHFSGHGSPSGEFVFTGDSGEMKLVGGDALASVFAALNRP